MGSSPPRRSYDHGFRAWPASGDAPVSSGGFAIPYLYLAIAICGEVIATSFLKQSEGFTRLVPTLVTAAGYLVAFYFLSLALRDVPTGIAYAIWSGAGIVLITTIAWIFQGQKLDAAALLGMALIIAGVVIMNVFSRSAAH